ncbi:DNA methyltransferase, partial [Brachybacterium alimentarium]|uniref:DNA methyltransferase n=1 Tax=Brachybacterium alimentarium TaxID=47845 RepID=UPI003FCEFBBE
GWGTALKPAWEPIILARKPLAGTVAGNVLTHGTGALNIDACRVPMSDSDRAAIDAKHAGMDLDSYERAAGVSLNLSVNPMPLKAAKGHEAGRFPANVLIDEAAGAAIDEQTGVTRSRIGKPRGAKPGDGWGMTATGSEYDDEGGASRFFYSAKADNAERPVVDGVAHPTVKPLALMEWLIRLVTPPGGTVLEPFSGSGTTLEAAQYTGHRAIGIEKGDEYLPLIVHRLERTDPRVKAPKPLEVHPDQLDMLSMLGGIA